MKRHVALTLLIVTALGVLNAHVDLPRVDGRRFVATQGQLYDPLGWLEDQANAWGRRCDKVASVPLSSQAAQEVLTRIGAFSPPDSHTARALSLLRAGPWWLAEVSFESLSPAVVALHGEGPAMKIIERAIWSGSTSPWRPAPRIRDHLLAGAPGISTDLVACLEPQSELFRP
jgi:hypothetical protein